MPRGLLGKKRDLVLILLEMGKYERARKDGTRRKLTLQGNAD